MSRDRDRGDVARVYIGDLGSGGSKPELEREFERYGPLKSVWVARNPPGIKRHLLYLVLILLPANPLSLLIPSPVYIAACRATHNFLQSLHNERIH